MHTHWVLSIAITQMSCTRRFTTCDWCRYWWELYDQLALLPVTNRFMYLEEGLAWLVLQLKYLQTVNLLSERAWRNSKQCFKRWIQALKEIYEQPEAIKQTISQAATAYAKTSCKMLKQTLAKRTDYCMWYKLSLRHDCEFEQLIGVPCQVEIASEFRPL